MALPNIEPGYIGIGIFEFGSLRCTDFSVNVDQEFGFYNHIIGLNDTSPAGSSTKGEDIGIPRVQRKFIKPNPLSIKGNISFPATEAALSYFYNKIRTGEYLDFSFYYYCGYGRMFQSARLESFSFDINAGDILSVSVGFVAKVVNDIAGVAPYDIPEKLITWDVVSVKVNDVDFDSELLKGFSLDVKNPINLIYTLQPNNAFSSLGPKDLRIGTQEVSGTISVYLVTGANKLNECDTPGQVSTIDLKIGLAFTATLSVRLLPKQTAGSVGPVVTTVGYVGVDFALQ